MLEGLGHEIDGLRHLITELRPAALDDLGLAAALRGARQARPGDRRAGRETEIDLSGIARSRGRANGNGGERLDPELESTIYRVAQEALTNVSRHAEATSAVVSVSEHDGHCERRSPTTARACPDQERLGPRGDGLEGGFGMSGMRERAELVGGELKLRPAPGQGHRGAPERAAAPAARRPTPCAAADAAPRPAGGATQSGPCGARRR